MLSLFSSVLFAQNREEAEKLVNEGIPYHDKGDYEGAITRYDKALTLDKDNLLALTEKSLTLLAAQKYDESIQLCQRAIESHKGDKKLRTVYVNYGNALDGLKKTDKSLEIYDEGIKAFPDFYQLWFNKGITLSSVKKNNDALECFQKALMINPNHPGSLNAMARILHVDNKRIPALLAYSRFLVVEPQTKRSNENLMNLLKIMKANVEQTGKKSTNINIIGDDLKNSDDKGKSKENNFFTADLILSMQTALDFENLNKDNTEVARFIRKIDKVCSALKESKKDNSGFYWDYFAPYFIKMLDEKYIETFAYVAFASSDYPDVSTWLKSHDSEINKFYEWSKSFKWKTN